MQTAVYSSVFSTTDANCAYDKFMNIYKSLLQISCPVKMIKLHRKFIKREPWITKGLIMSSINNAKLLKNKLKTQSPELVNKHRIYCSIFNTINRAAKVKYYTEMLNTHKQDIKETW